MPITFDALDGSPQHAPLVVGSVGGIETGFVLDTGSEVHILTKELVDRLGLEVEPGEEGVDHSGATTPSWSVEDVELSLGEIALMLGDVVSIPAPPPFPSKGIGGILSPQHLHPSAVTVIDLAGHELLLVEGSDDEIAAWLGDGAVERLGGGVSGADVIGSSGGEQVVVVAGHDVPVGTAGGARGDARPAGHGRNRRAARHGARVRCGSRPAGRLAAAGRLTQARDERLETDRRRRFGELSVGDHHHRARVQHGLGRGEVDRVVAPEGMGLGERARPARERPGQLEDIDLRPQRVETVAGLEMPRIVDSMRATCRCERGPSLRVKRDGRHRAFGVVPCRADSPGSGLDEKQLHERRSVEVRAQRRCSMTMSLRVAPSASTGAGRRPFGRRPGISVPSRISRSTFRSPFIGTSRATGLPCSVTTISSPRLTRSTYRESPARNSLMPTSTPEL